MTGPTFHFDFSLTTENPEVAQAHAKAVATFMAAFSGQGSAAQNHARATARAPRAVADAPEGSTDKDLRKWLTEADAAAGTETQIDGKPMPVKGRLPKVWRDMIIAARAEAEAEETNPEDMLDAEVVEMEETPAPATKGPRKWTRTGKTGAPKA